ncbi:glycoside hydrolase family 130 protein [Hufsiella ginkgonis]|uniref:Glycosidase n=1 Tax=Hufsiella ginkgonis TaxID=2695274 RepID=A0A7K1Y1S3_9SPHI|nr:glycoside hydrolase family 130 protein [Hufsiella ginkgonis]MXV17067.1 glycosidase [Hufsiella ginkgonis]
MNQEKIVVNRSTANPLLRPQDLRPSMPGMKIECLLNPGMFEFEGRTGMLVRVAERPPQVDGKVSFPIFNAGGLMEILNFDADDEYLDLSDARLVTYNGVVYLSTISHLRLLWSDDGENFTEPDPSFSIFGSGALETFGVEDCRVSKVGGTYYLTYTAVSENGVGVGMISTSDWKTLHRHGMIIPPHNKDCALFEEKINGLYYCLHRPSGIDLGGNYIWIASSPDLIHWGDHRCILRTRAGMWDSARVGGGCAPIKTDRGWLAIYHGATAQHRYCLGGLLLDLNDPAKVLARSGTPIMEPQEPYEVQGFFGEVIFTNGHIIKGDELTVYYGAADEVICSAKFSINAILESLVPV